jgi:NitT/TauT family transport system permease protein
VADVPYQTSRTVMAMNRGWARMLIPAVFTVLAAGVVIFLFMRFYNFAADDPLLRDSTVGELAAWMAGQAEEDAPESLLGQWAKGQQSDDLEAAFLIVAQRGLILITGAAVVLAATALVGMMTSAGWVRTLLVIALLFAAALLFLVPTIEGDNTLLLVLLACVLLVLAYSFASGKITRVQSFVVVLCVILLVWEGSKALAASANYRVILPTSGWQYNKYPSLDDALKSLQDGNVQVIVADRSEVRDLMADEDGVDASTFTYPDLRYLSNMQTEQFGLGMFPIEPAFPGRLAVVVTADQTSIHSLDDLSTRRVGAVEGEFADTDYLSAVRDIELVDLKILNDLNLPHLQNIAEALLQPARRNGPLLLIRILSEAALHTWSEAILGFASGATLGFVLGTLFAHFLPLERGLLPYVVASQTVPILAIAPMVVIWLGAGPQAVAVISAYLTFFPVTINTLRGLRSPNSSMTELMSSYAASRWETMWKLRFPAALPYIFTALKVSATASVVGAIIGELPSSIRSGLGRAILDFSSDYSLVSTPKLWGAILVAASIGILSFMIVSLVERLVVGRYVRSA